MTDRRNDRPQTLVRRHPLKEGVSRAVVTPIQPYRPWVRRVVHRLSFARHIICGNLHP